ncbi:MAG: hypothetical protein KAU14_01635 [Thermoplasmata archaeon]|nr:hypothetical protein [Thermoplasmata archaeon]
MKRRLMNIVILAFLGLIILLIIGASTFTTDGSGTAIADIYPTEIQDTGNSNEWVEMVNTIDKPVNLYELYLSPESGTTRAPSTYFPDGVSDLSAYGVPADLNDHTFYLNAESLYIDRYYTDFYLYKVKTGNGYGKAYYKGGGSWMVWYNDSGGEFINETERNNTPPNYLDNIYQIDLPDIWFFRHQYVLLNGDNETGCSLYDHDPGGNVLDIDLGNTSSVFADYLVAEEGGLLNISTLEGIYIDS